MTRKNLYHLVILGIEENEAAELILNGQLVNADNHVQSVQLFVDDLTRMQEQLVKRQYNRYEPAKIETEQEQPKVMGETKSSPNSEEDTNQNLHNYMDQSVADSQTATTSESESTSMHISGEQRRTHSVLPDIHSVHQDTSSGGTHPISTTSDVVEEQETKPDSAAEDNQNSEQTDENTIEQPEEIPNDPFQFDAVTADTEVDLSDAAVDAIIADTQLGQSLNSREEQLGQLGEVVD